MIKWVGPQETTTALLRTSLKTWRIATNVASVYEALKLRRLESLFEVVHISDFLVFKKKDQVLQLDHSKLKSFFASQKTKVHIGHRFDASYGFLVGQVCDFASAKPPYLGRRVSSKKRAWITKDPHVEVELAVDYNEGFACDGIKTGVRCHLKDYGLNTADGWMLLVRRPPIGAMLVNADRDNISNKYIPSKRDAWVFCEYKFGIRKCVVDDVKGDGNAMITWCPVAHNLKKQVREEQLINDKY